jgi:hypothetical protein
MRPAAALTSACCKRQAGSLPAESGWQPDFQVVHRRASRVDKFNRRDTQRSFAFAQDDKHEGKLYQTALAKIAEITAGGTLHKIYGELEQANFPRVIYAVDNRAKRFVFALHLPHGAINHCVD